MKNRHLLATALLLCVLTTACHQPTTYQYYEPEVLSETYVHRYGVEVPGDEWSENGSSGKVVSTRADGVTMTRSFQEGVLCGESSYTFPMRSQTECVEQYDQGRLVKRQTFYLSGSPCEEIDYSASPTITTKQFYDGGTLRTVETTNNGRIVQGKYYNANGNVEAGVENGFGKRTNRDAFGQSTSVDTIQEGEMILRTTYHPNGIPQAQMPYDGQVIHGTVKRFKPAGDPQAMESWHRGQQDGVTTLYEDGEKVAEVPYVRGQKHGVERRFADSGERVIEEITWVEGSRHGPAYRYVNGQVVEEWFFRDQKTTQAGFERLSGPHMR